MSPVLPPDGSGSGFRRWPAHVKAVSLCDAVSVLDPPRGHNGPIADESVLLRSAADFADRAGKKATWLHIPSERISADLRFALAIDIENGPRRARAILCRAFARADVVAAKHAQEIDDRQHATATSRKIHDELEGYQSAFVLIRRRYHNSDRCEDLEREAEQAIRTLRVVAERLREIGTAGVAFGRSLQDPGRAPRVGELFLTLRILELCALATGETPVFYDAWISRPDPPAFLLMAYAAHSIMGNVKASRGEKKAIGDSLNRARKFEEGGAPNLKERWPNEFKKGPEVRRLCSGALASEGVALNVWAGPPPATRTEAYEEKAE